MSRARVIHLEPLAPGKPAPGAACNGCGVCCLAEPCPVGIVLSRRRQGACAALRWQAGEARYRCGAIGRWPLLDRLLLRWIGSGAGCDCDLEVAVQSDRQSNHD